ncbi:hypothetical protein [Thalassospira xiamenensis]|uniref:Uncharacterized protein n=1 Tax=Thalassospira xiamenensis TaxID=220697 RepID=A0A285TWJ4_9PROT|nr:hypothetical protein [Thalassospira xiamenensis]SOC26737.1 hypothetical protein SAMN05428964_105194 [Thalassospira xiamenensis]
MQVVIPYRYIIRAKCRGIDELVYLSRTKEVSFDIQEVAAGAAPVVGTCTFSDARPSVTQTLFGEKVTPEPAVFHTEYRNHSGQLLRKLTFDYSSLVSPRHRDCLVARNAVEPSDLASIGDFVRADDFQGVMRLYAGAGLKEDAPLLSPVSVGRPRVFSKPKLSHYIIEQIDADTLEHAEFEVRQRLEQQMCIIDGDIFVPSRGPVFEYDFRAGLLVAKPEMGHLPDRANVFSEQEIKDIELRSSLCPDCAVVGTIEGTPTSQTDWVRLHRVLSAARRLLRSSVVARFVVGQRPGVFEAFSALAAYAEPTFDWRLRPGENILFEDAVTALQTLVEVVSSEKFPGSLSNELQALIDVERLHTPVVNELFMR